MPPVTTDPNKVRSGRVDMNARRLGSGEDAATRKAWRLPNHRPMRFDSAGRGMLPKATGLPGSVKKRKSTDGDSAGPPAKKSRTAQRDASKPDPLDVSGVSLDHDLDEEGEVRVFDTCDTIRRKIRTFLTKYESEGVTQAAFLRAISNAAFADTQPRRKIQHAQLTTFMGQRGTMNGKHLGRVLRRLRLLREAAHQGEKEQVGRQGGGRELSRRRPRPVIGARECVLPRLKRCLRNHDGQVRASGRLLWIGLVG
ncbi:hypothetical protein QBC37DRAFT_424879 [Rhypophila decipiens]|uniref:DUF7726 domain-containing protein n=1 Tax=Rhypophila decipiens TaxID=261697 RepID=A0AAN6YAG3_9PEZI|nr:hypothetical protein QBC37DRAFT_424879 [Rhypophila decipiens]